MLHDGKRLEATRENALLLIEQALPHLPPAEYFFSTMQVVFAKRCRYPWQNADQFDFFNIYDTDEPELNPDSFKWVLDWDDKEKKWRHISEEDYAYIFGE